MPRWFGKRRRDKERAAAVDALLGAAQERGIPTLPEFFGDDLAASLVDRGTRADIIHANNVLAHVPDLNDFVAGLKLLLAPGGVVTMEFPQLLHLIDRNYWDTIYHEHFSYLSFTTVEKVFARHGLTLFDVETLPTHGGSLRIYGAHAEDDAKPLTDSARELLEREASSYASLEAYTSFAHRVEDSKRQILSFLVDLKRQGRRVAGYGAPAKGNTLLNYCGIRTDFVDFTVDVNPNKQGHYLPGSHIPVRAPDALREARPDVVLILPWNLREEIMEQHAYVREWGGQFAARAPELRFVP